MDKRYSVTPSNFYAEKVGVRRLFERDVDGVLLHSSIRYTKLPSVVNGTSIQ